VSNNRTSKKINQLLIDLSSDSESKITTAVLELASVGELEVIPELINILKENANPVRQKLISKLLSDIQISGATEVFVEILRKEDNQETLRLILPILWESRLDFSVYLADFVELSVSGDYLVALDCLTLMENMPGPFSESQLLESQLHLKEFIENKERCDERKAQIISEIALFVKDQNDGIDADLLLD
jgi:hypothetical protein